MPDRESLRPSKRQSSAGDRREGEGISPQPAVCAKGGPPIRGRWRLTIALVGLLGAVALAIVFWPRPSGRGRPEAIDVAVAEAAPAIPPADEELIGRLCTRCHQLPVPDILPKSAWPKTVWLMSTFGGFGSNIPAKVYPDAVAAWFESRAPEAIPLPEIEIPPAPGSLRLQKREIPWTGAPSAPFVSHIRLADVAGDERPELLVCDMKNGAILIGRTGEPGWALEPVGQVPNPAHVEAVDLDKDGRMDLVVANLGSFLALDHKLGSVEWFRQREDKTFEKITLAADLGRVADAQPADIDGDGDIDLVVAEFGWRWTGHLLIMENRAAPGGKPSFVTTPVEGNHGASHVGVTDLDGDGRLDIVALYSQEHERVRCYLQRKGQWTELHDLYQAPHPAWGHSGMLLVDLDRDGDQDVLLTNGDTYDSSLLKPYHGIRWLENKGKLVFETHDLAAMYGVYRAEAGDIDGDGDLDIAACAMAERDNVEGQVNIETFTSILWLEQVTPGRFLPRGIEKSECHHANLALGDYDQDGKTEIIVGNGRFDDAMVPPTASCIDIWDTNP